jgi:hypothetical protein
VFAGFAVKDSSLSDAFLKEIAMKLKRKVMVAPSVPSPPTELQGSGDGNEVEEIAGDDDSEVEEIESDDDSEVQDSETVMRTTTVASTAVLWRIRVCPLWCSFET